MKAKEYNLYEIFEVHSNKYMRFIGFDYEGDDDGDGPWRHVETRCEWVLLDADLAKDLKSSETDWDAAETFLNLLGGAWYSTDMEEDEMADVQARYTCRELPLSAVETDTPCGEYFWLS